MSNPPPKTELESALDPLRPVFLRVAALSFTTGLLSLAPSLYMLEVYDRVTNSRSFTTLLMLTLLVVGVYAAMELLEWVRAQALRHAGMKAELALGGRVFDAVFRGSLQRGQAGSQQALNDLRTLRDFLASPPVLAAVEAPAVLVILAILFAIHPLLGWAAVVGAIAQTGIAWLTERRTRPPLAAANAANNAAQTYAANSLRNAQVIEAMGMLRGVEARWLKRQNEFLTQQAKASNYAGSLTATAKAVQMILSSAMLGLGCWLILTGRLIDGGGLMIIGSILGGRVMQPIVQLVSNWKMVEEARGAYGRIDELLRRHPPAPKKMSLPPPTGVLSVEGLTAGAPGNPVPILRNVNFALAAGECLAVIGPSAAGKTTLMRLLMGLWPALAGKVRLDGADVHAWDKAELGPHVGYLPQDVELFDGTLAENIARFGEVDDAAVEAAGRLVGLDELAAELPEGYDSRIGEDGSFLSGGQRQRVGLARAIYGSPRLVVLDEPNSSLDESGEAALVALLRHLKAQQATVVMVTHRPNVLLCVDKILLLVGGAVQAFGPRDEVLAALAKARQQAPAAQSPAAPPRPPLTVLPPTL